MYTQGPVMQQSNQMWNNSNQNFSFQVTERQFLINIPPGYANQPIIQQQIQQHQAPQVVAPQTFAQLPPLPSGLDSTEQPILNNASDITIQDLLGSQFNALPQALNSAQTVPPTVPPTVAISGQLMVTQGYNGAVAVAQPSASSANNPVRYQSQMGSAVQQNMGLTSQISTTAAQSINPNQYRPQNQSTGMLAPRPSTTAGQATAIISSNTSVRHVNQNSRMVQAPQAPTQNIAGVAYPPPSYENSVNRGNLLIGHNGNRNSQVAATSNPKCGQIKVRTVESLNGMVGQKQITKQLVRGDNINIASANSGNKNMARPDIPSQITGNETFEDIFNEKPSNTEEGFQPPLNYTNNSNTANRNQQHQGNPTSNVVTNSMNTTRNPNLGAYQNASINRNCPPPNVSSSALVVNNLNSQKTVENVNIRITPPNVHSNTLVHNTGNAHQAAQNVNIRKNSSLPTANASSAQNGSRIIAQSQPGFLRIYPPAGANSTTKAVPPTNKLPPATLECAVQQNSKPTATHRLPMTVEKPTSKVPITCKSNIDLNQSRRSLQASVLAKSGTGPTPNRSSLNLPPDGANIAQTSFSPTISTLPSSLPVSAGPISAAAVTVPTSSSSPAQNVPVPTSSSISNESVPKKDDGLLKQLFENTDEFGTGSKQKEDIPVEKTIANDEAHLLTATSIFKDFLKGTTEVNVLPTAEANVESVDKTMENDRKDDKNEDKESGKKEETNILDSIIIQAITKSSKQLKYALNINEEESPRNSPPPTSRSTSPPISTESSVNVLYVDPNQSEAEIKMLQNLEVPIKKKPGPKSKTMPAYLESLKKIDGKNIKDSHLCEKPEFTSHVSEKNSKTIQTEEDLAEKTKTKKKVEKISTSNEEEKVLAKKQREKTLIENPKDKNIKNVNESSDKKQEPTKRKPSDDWVTKLKNTASHFVSKEDPSTQKSPEKRKSKDADSEVPPTKKSKLDPSSKSEKKPEAVEDRVHKLEILKKYVGSDEDSDPKRRLSSDDESSSRRKISKKDVVKNRNMEREKIALVSKDFRAKSKQDEKKVSESNKKPKIGPKFYKESQKTSPKVTEADSSIIDQNDETKKSDEDSNNNSQTSSIDDDVKPPLTETTDAASLSPARITSTSEEFDLDGMMQAFASIDYHRCMHCAKTSATNAFWINVKSSELKCTGCLTKVPTKDNCYNKKHEEEIKKLRQELKKKDLALRKKDVEIQDLKKKNRKLEKKCEKRVDPTVFGLFKNMDQLHEKMLSDSD